MHRSALLSLLCLASSLAGRAACGTELNYTLYVLALPAGDATLSFDLGPPSYRMSLRFHTTGLADLFVSDRLDEHTAGRIENDQPVPLEYGSIARLHGHDRSVEMAWRDDTPVTTEISPPNSTEREEVPAALLPHAVNPLDAIIVLMRQVARTGRCEGISRAFDGRRLQMLQAWTGGEDDLPPTGRSMFSGRALRCEFSDRTLAGYRPGAGHDDDLRERRGTIWLARVFPGGQRLPVRTAVETRWLGDATIYLTSASP